MGEMACGLCHSRSIVKGRAFDGRRAYRCAACGAVWTAGTNNREPRYSRQRTGYQFHDTGAKPN